MIFSEKRISSIALIVCIISTHLMRFAVSVNCDIEPRGGDGKLRKSLLCKYDKTVHPSQYGDPVLVSMTMEVMGFLFDEYSKVMHISSWVRLIWQDPNLRWTPSEFNNITNFVELAEEIWHPDFQMFNSDIASGQGDLCRDIYVDIGSTGDVLYVPPCLHSASCEADFTGWPFDSLNCTLHIVSWMNSANEVELKLEPISIDMERSHSQDKSWNMVKASYQKNPGYYPEIDERYPSVSFTFLLERHSGVYAIAFLVPALVMVSINLITLWMSPEVSHRLILLAFNVLSHFIYMQQLSWYVPFNGDTCPTIVLCFRDSLIITGFLLVNTVIVRGFTTCGFDIPNWVDSTTGSLGSHKFGQLFLSKNYLIDTEPLHSEQPEEAVDVNGSEPQTLPTVVIKSTTNTWVIFAKFVDRLLFVIVVVLYVCMYFALIPRGYKFPESTSHVEVVQL